MAYTTVNDLKRDALWRAGEPAELDANGVSTSDYDERALDYMNAVQQGLLLGSPLSIVDERGQPLPAVDWWWSRKSQHGTIYLDTEYVQGTVSIVQGSTTATFSVDTITGGTDFTNWRLRVGNRQTVSRIVSAELSGGVTVATLDARWPEDTTTDSYTAFPVEASLPADFLRFSGPMVVPGEPWEIDVVDDAAMNAHYPIHAIVAGTPTSAALVGSQTVRFNRYRSQTTGPLRIEFPYIYMPSDMALGGTPIIPAHHRRLLSTGAAYYILLDKSDSKSDVLKAEFRGLWGAMLQEHMRHMRRMSRRFGQLHYRLEQMGRRPVVTQSGLVISGGYGSGGYGGSGYGV
jgi:hypothetical protein